MSNTLRGVLWMSGAVASFTAMAIAVRALQRHMGSFEIVFLRSVVMLAMVAAMLPRAGVTTIRTGRFKEHLSRNVIHFLGQVLWVYSIGVLTLATVFAIEFTMPMWTALLAWLFLKERLTYPRLVMLGLGLLGRSRRSEPRPWRAVDRNHYERRSAPRPVGNVAGPDFHSSPQKRTHPSCVHPPLLG